MRGVSDTHACHVPRLGSTAASHFFALHGYFLRKNYFRHCNFRRRPPSSVCNDVLPTVRARHTNRGLPVFRIALLVHALHSTMPDAPIRAKTRGQSRHAQTCVESAGEVRVQFAGVTGERPAAVDQRIVEFEQNPLRGIVRCPAARCGAPGLTRSSRRRDCRPDLRRSRAAATLTCIAPHVLHECEPSFAAPQALASRASRSITRCGCDTNGECDVGHSTTCVACAAISRCAPARIARSSVQTT